MPTPPSSPVIDAFLRDCAVTFLKRGRRATNISSIINARPCERMTVDIVRHSATDMYRRYILFLTLTLHTMYCKLRVVNVSFSYHTSVNYDVLL